MDTQQGPTIQQQRMLLNVMWQPGWEGSLGENGHMYMHGWVSLSSTWNHHNAVNRLCACACSIAKSCLTPRDPMNCSLPGYTPIQNKKLKKKNRSLAFISPLSYLFSQTHVQEMGCPLPLPGGSTGWNSTTAFLGRWRRLFGWSMCFVEDSHGQWGYKSRLGSAWGGVGKREKEATFLSSQPCSWKHTSATAHLHSSSTGEGATPLNFKASLERGLFSNQGDWRYFGSKTLWSHCLRGSLTTSYVSDTGGIYSLEAWH